MLEKYAYRSLLWMSVLMLALMLMIGTGAVAKHVTAPLGAVWLVGFIVSLGAFMQWLINTIGWAKALKNIRNPPPKRGEHT